ncbi:hypothetical protein DPMN_014816 [Dreissena polymorpha]|uniref:Uncharacterized protein n=1 Tax=Dreissena polymorpha TaxID=45954 RepID=A0A9D4S515_DREPO|nr:hypothetical protein DPMN_014816 [Dreissena polymorpha]
MVSIEDPIGTLIVPVTLSLQIRITAIVQDGAVPERPARRIHVERTEIESMQ